MGLRWLTRHILGILTWAFLAMTIIGIVLASIGGATNARSLTDTGAGLIIGPVTVGILLAAGGALMHLRDRETRLAQIAGDIADILGRLARIEADHGERLTRIESEQLASVDEMLRSINDQLGGSNVRQFRRGS